MALAGSWEPLGLFIELDKLDPGPRPGHFYRQDNVCECSFTSMLIKIKRMQIHNLFQYELSELLIAMSMISGISQGIPWTYN